MAAESKTKHYVNVFLRYFVLILVGLIMIYPLVWMVGATFKSNAEIFPASVSSRRTRHLRVTKRQWRATAEQSTYGRQC